MMSISRQLSGSRVGRNPGEAGPSGAASPTAQSPSTLPSAHLGLSSGQPFLGVPVASSSSSSSSPASSGPTGDFSPLDRAPSGSSSSRLSISQASSSSVTRVPSPRLTPGMLPPLSTVPGQASGSGSNQKATPSSGGGGLSAAAPRILSRAGSHKDKQKEKEKDKEREADTREGIWSAGGLLRRTSKGKGKGKEDTSAKLGHEFGWSAQAGDGWKSPLSETGSSEVIETPQMTSSRDPETGRKMINQYLVLHEIGRGTHGTVRLGRDMSVDLPAGELSESGHPLPPSPPHVSFPSAPFYAIKMVDRVPRRKKLQTLRKASALGGAGGLGGSKSGDAKLLVGESEIRKEIAILKKVNHPNIVRMKEIIDDPVQSKIFMVLEYCQGGEIKWKEDDGSPALSVAETRKIMRDTLLGLEYLHHQGIIHRDIKPSNLLIAGDDRVKISDFGCSHYSEALREASAVQGPEGDRYVDDIELAKTAGSPAFFAPEMCYSGFEDGGEPDTRSLSPAQTPNQEMPAFILRPPSVLVDGMDRSMASSPVTLSPSGRPVPLQSTLSSESIPRQHQQPQQQRGRPAAALRTQSSATIARRKDRLPITNAIDVWAMGVTLYCLLFARTPFDAPNEYLLMQVIPTAAYDVPPTMGRDRLSTSDNAEAKEALDLLSKLLEKDPAKRITLDRVKKHPFVLRGLADASNWLVSTDLHAQTFVTVSNDEVAAAVTKSSSFRDRLRRGMKLFGTKLQILGGGVGNSAARINRDGFEGSALPSNESSATPSTATSSISLQGTPRQTGSRTRRGSTNVGEFGQRDGTTPLMSPNNSQPPGTPSGSVARRLSIFGGRWGGGGGGGTDSQPRTPLAQTDTSGGGGLKPSATFVANMNRAASADQVPTDRSVEGTQPQQGFIVHRPQTRSTNANLQPVADVAPRKTISTTSLDKLQTAAGAGAGAALGGGSRASSMVRRQSSDIDAAGRQRSPSNASSGARSGLSAKIAKLLNRSGSQQSRFRKRADTGRSEQHDQAVSDRYLGERDDGADADLADDHAVTTASGGTSPAEAFRRLSIGDELGRKSLDTFDSGSMSSRLGLGMGGGGGGGINGARVHGSGSGSVGGFSYPSPDRAGGMLGLPDWEARLRSTSAAAQFQHDRRGSSATSAVGDDHEPEEYDYNEPLHLSDDDVDEPIVHETLPTHLISPISPVGGGPAILNTGSSTWHRDRLPEAVTPPHVHALQPSQNCQQAFFSHHTLGPSHTHHHGRSPLAAGAAANPSGGLELDLTDEGEAQQASAGGARSILIPPSAAVERKHSFSHVSAAPTLEAIPDASPPTVSTGISVHSFSSSSRDEGSPIQQRTATAMPAMLGRSPPTSANSASRLDGMATTTPTPRTPPMTATYSPAALPVSPSHSAHSASGSEHSRRTSPRIMSTSPTTRTHGGPDRAKSPLGRMYINGSDDDDEAEEQVPSEWTGQSKRLGTSPASASGGYSPVRSRPVRDDGLHMGRSSPVRHTFLENGSMHAARSRAENNSPSPKVRTVGETQQAGNGHADDDDEDDGALAINTANRRGRKGSLYGRRQPSANGGEVSPVSATPGGTVPALAQPVQSKPDEV